MIICQNTCTRLKMLCFCLFCLFETGSWCVALVCLALAEICFPLLSECWVPCACHPTQQSFILKVHLFLFIFVTSEIQTQKIPPVLHLSSHLLEEGLLFLDAGITGWIEGRKVGGTVLSMSPIGMGTWGKEEAANRWYSIELGMRLGVRFGGREGEEF